MTIQPTPAQIFEEWMRVEVRTQINLGHITRLQAAGALDRLHRQLMDEVTAASLPPIAAPMPPPSPL